MLGNVSFVKGVSMSIMLTEGHDPHAHARAIRARGQRLKRCDRRSLKREFLRLFPRHDSVKATCAHLLVSRTTFYGWLLRDSDFADKYNGMINSRFEHEMARLDRRYARANDDEYWRMLPEAELIRAAARLMSKDEREAFYGR